MYINNIKTPTLKLALDLFEFLGRVHRINGRTSGNGANALNAITVRDYNYAHREEEYHDSHSNDGSLVEGTGICSIEQFMINIQPAGQTSADFVVSGC